MIWHQNKEGRGTMPGFPGARRFRYALRMPRAAELDFLQKTPEISGEPIL
jgi:hypothetical protein